MPHRTDGASEDCGSTRFGPGDVVASRFVVDHVIGEGASGTVYAAHRDPDGVRVALKVIHPSLCHDSHFLGRFMREATILKQLEGNHIARLLDVVLHDELPVLVLEWVDGRSLDAAMRDRWPTIDEAVEITLQICAALGAAHAGGFVHRDLKPANVLVQGEFGGARVPTVWVVDFGLGKALHPDTTSVALTERDLILGTPEYMSPEQARGDDVDHRCDIYAAALILFEMLAHRRPFVGRSSMDTMTAHIYEPVPSLRSLRPECGVSPALEAVLFRALAKNPDERYASSRAFAEAISAARSATHVVALRRVDADNAGAFAEGDTELELRDEAREARRDANSALNNPPPDVAMSTAPAVKSASTIWIALAIVAIVVGAVIGAR